MTPEDAALLKNRKANFPEFYDTLIPTLVGFLDAMGIQPSHEALKNAVKFAPHLEHALQKMAIETSKERGWLLLRTGQFIGEYFVQKYSGCWYVNEIEGSRYFGRYVVGRFASLKNMVPMLDPFQIAQVYIDTPTPRYLEKLLQEVDAELVHLSDASSAKQV